MRLFAVVLAVFLVCGSAYAYLDNENTQDQDQGQAQGQQQGQGQLQGQAQGQGQGQAQAAIAAQGQIAVGKVKTSTDVSISDNSKTETTAIAFPSTGATEGVASANASYMFGNLGLSDTEIYKKGGFIIQTVLAIPDDIISKEEKAAIVKDVVVKMQKSVKPRRWFSIGPEQHSKNLINLFGLLSIDSFWKDNQRPFQRQKDIK